MANWPGTGIGSPSGIASVIVTVSASSRTDASTAPIVGVIVAETGSARIAGSVEVEELQPGRTQARPEHGGEASVELMAELGVGCALAAQTGGVDLDGAAVFHRRRVEFVHVRFGDPRDAQDLARSEAVDGDRAPSSAVEFDVDASLPDDPEVVGRCAGGDDALAFGEGDVDAAAGDQFEEVWAEVAQRRVGGQLVGEKCRQSCPMGR